MISAVLKALDSGLQIMRNNSRLLLVGVLLFVFPLLFIWITQNFFETAYHNIDSAEKRRVSLLHESLVTTLKVATNPEEVTPALIEKFTAENSDISKIRVVKKKDNDFVIVFANDSKVIDTVEKTDQAFRTLPLAGSNDSFIYESVIDGVRTWQAFRSVEVGDDDYFIFSEHKFNVIDGVMSARRQQSYFGLTAIFIFLIALAYWLNKQTEWQKNNRLLKLQLTDRDMFSNMIAHEFRSPLTAIKGYASFLEESPAMQPEERRFASNIKKSAERLVVLVSDFLEVARLQSGKLKIEKTQVDMAQVLKSIVEDLHKMAEEKSLGLIFIEPKKDVTISTDGARMIQIMTNIVTNAIKYTNQGKVEIECEKIPGEFILRVKDTGMGISAEDQQKLFAPFIRVGGVDSTATTGSGLGMWITRQLVELLNGKIGVESIKGVGTHVVLIFKI